MIKSILICVNILGILLLGVFQKNAVEATQDIPLSMQPGQEVVVTVEVKKSDVSGFAKYQITLDEGLRAEVVESAGASFTFKDQKAKFIWMSLPTSKSFVLKYRIISDPDVTGQLNVSSRFSYIYKNERKNFDLPVHQIAVGMDGEMAADTTKPVVAPPSNAGAIVSADRMIASVGINQWEVDIVVSKTSLEGFAKIEETIPQGYTALDLNANGAVFSLNDQTLKYIWYDLPQNEKVRVKYKLLPVVAMDGTIPQLSGDFSYLQNEETIRISIGEMESEVIVMTADTAAIDTTSIIEPMAEVIPEPKEEPVVEPIETPATVGAAVAVVIPVPNKEEPEEEVIEPPVVEAPPVVEPMVADKSPVDGNIVDVPMPETGVYYRVQLAAGKNNIKKDDFSSMFSFNEVLKLENINGWFKYTTGHHQVYKAARNDRTRITGKYQKFQGPFVTAYNDGERISVQEALMITSQKWYQ